MAFVFQEAQLLPWRSILDNVALPLELQGLKQKERHELVMSALAEVRLADAAEYFPHQLSGGMKMRAALAQALVTKPKILLLDEPFSALDELIRQDLGQMLYELWLTHSLTVILVTHSISEALYLSSRILMLSQQPARILLDYQVALPQQRQPELRSSPEFLRQQAILIQNFDRREP